MKSISFLLFSFIFIINSYSQNFSFVDPSNKWKTDFYYRAIPFPEERTYFFNGDSIEIDGAYFHVLSYTSKLQQTPTLSHYKFRQDEPRLWSASFSNTPYLLMDFSAELGDTIPTSLSGFSGSESKVVSLRDTILDDGNMTKLYGLICAFESADPNDISYWIDGVGELVSPFQSESKCSLFDPSGYNVLKCFSRNDVVLYKNKNFPDCNTLALASEDSIQAYLYPNPGFKDFYIFSNTPVKSWKMYNSTGRLLHQNYSSIFQCENLSVGIYCIVIEFKNGAYLTKKWLKTSQ